MKDLPPETYFKAIDATWAPARFVKQGPFTLRVGNGGGKRVSAATLNGIDASIAEIETASRAMIEMAQTPLFMLKPGQDALDATLETLGFEVIDPVILYACPAEDLAQHAEMWMKVIPCDAPLAVQREIWASDDIGPERIEVMERSSDPKSFLLARHEDKASGAVFVANHGEIAMLHALTISGHARRLGVGRNLTCGCAKWAMDQGAKTFALLTTEANAPARALYEGLGMTAVSRYHYRIKSP